MKTEEEENVSLRGDQSLYKSQSKNAITMVLFSFDESAVETWDVL